MIKRILDKLFPPTRTAYPMIRNTASGPRYVENVPTTIEQKLERDPVAAGWVATMAGVFGVPADMLRNNYPAEKSAAFGTIEYKKGLTALFKELGVTRCQFRDGMLLMGFEDGSSLSTPYEDLTEIRKQIETHKRRTL